MAVIEGAPGYWYSRYLFERALALVYLVAFTSAANQFVPLMGARGLLPAARFIEVVPFRAAPSLFFFFPTDTAFRVAAWLGIALSCLVLTGYPQQRGMLTSAAVWASMWVLYLSFVNVGQTFYAFGWESLLLEAGLLAIFVGGSATTPNALILWMWRWLLFRLMFGAGLIKIRGDACWRDLTCLNYFYETQPMPNPLSWYFHWLPESIHRAGVMLNHIVELGVPFAYFAPQPVAGIAAVVTIVFQLMLIVSGNLSWLNWLTIVLCIPLLDNRWLAWLPVTPPPLVVPPMTYRLGVAVLTGVVLILSIRPIRNMLSPQQLMNYSFNPLHLVNTYGAFGSITRTRDEIVLEGTDDADITDRTTWREYEFKGKPGDVSRLPPQVAPYHLRLDWLMWFAAFSPRAEDPWFFALVNKLLEGDTQVLGLLRTNPFPDHPPRYVRARYYRYSFTTPDARRRTGHRWRRDPLGLYLPPVTLDDLKFITPPFVQ